MILTPRQEELAKLNKETVAPLIKQLVQDIKEAHKEAVIQTYLNDIEEFVLQNSDRFSQDQDEKPKVYAHAFLWSLLCG